jgi:hypothetical protein
MRHNSIRFMEWADGRMGGHQEVLEDYKIKIN